MDILNANSLVNKRILLGVTGGIAAYKAAELLRRLQDRGAEVRVVMTKGATEFITPLTMQALSGQPVSMDLLDTESESAMGHIELARWADIILVAPATADFIARIVQGRADDLLAAICLAAECKVAIAPAMNQAMWNNASTQNNCKLLRERDYLVFGPEEGIQACGETGPGRLLDVDELVMSTSRVFPSGLLSGMQVLITAGPTREAIDPVRYISNHSSGKQGYSLAEAASEAGANVTLISGPTNLDAPERVQLIRVVSADEMYQAVMENAGQSDVFIGVAAVADYKPVQQKQQKIKKAGANSVQLDLIENPDIIATVAKLDAGPFTIGFAAETENISEYARKKLVSKKLDMIVANDVSDTSIGFNSDENKIVVFTANDEISLPKMSKHQLSRRLIELISTKISETRSLE